MENPNKIYTSSSSTLPSIPTDISLSAFLFESEFKNPDGVGEEKVVFEDDSPALSAISVIDDERDGGEEDGENGSEKGLKTYNRVTYGAFREGIRRDARVWREGFGVGGEEWEDGVVGICGGNSVNYIRCLHSILWAGGTVALFSAYSTIADFKHAFEICRPRIMVIEGDVIENVISALRALGLEGKTRVVILGPSTSHSGHPYFTYPTSFTSFKQPLPLSALKQTNNDRTAIICFSSGTSGLPKAVELSHYALIASLICLRASDREFYSSAGRGVFFAPLGHIFGLNTSLQTLYLLSYTLLLRTYTLPRLLTYTSLTRSNTLRIVPPIALALSLLPTAQINALRLENVKWILCSGARLEENVIRNLRERLGNAPIFQGYGMTEANICTMRAREGIEGRLVGSVGRVMAGVEARLVDDSFNDVDTGEAGEMVVRGPTLFRRYMNNPKATKEALHDGWFKTGDILRVDEDGYFWLVERKKDLIKYKGLQIPPSLLESHLSTHPFVQDSAVCALWSSSLQTELPIAYIILSPLGIAAKREEGEESVKKEVKEWVDKRVAGYMRLRGGVLVLEELPRGKTGKVLRRLLRDEQKGEKERAKL